MNSKEDKTFPEDLKYTQLVNDIVEEFESRFSDKLVRTINKATEQAVARAMELHKEYDEKVEAMVDSMNLIKIKINNKTIYISGTLTIIFIALLFLFIIK